MQRVVSINLNGNAYQVEEHGYNALFAYLDAAESALTDSPDRAQKLADLERVIAEKCQALLGPHKTVVTSAEVDRLLLELDPSPAQPAASSSSSSSSSSTASSTSSGAQPSSSWNAGHKRLFQIREGAMISGVCMGLSEFLHIDVTVIRILFVIFALVTSGWGLLAYGVLMFVVPKVDTRAAASGGTATGPVPPHHWPWDDGWPWDKHGWPWDTHGWPWDQPKTQGQSQTPPQGAPAPATPQSAPATRQDWRDQRREWREQRRAERMAHPGPVFGTMTMIICLMFGFFWLSFWTRGHFFFGWPFFWGFPHWFGIIFFFMMLRLIFMPFRMARWHAYGPYGPYTHPHYAWVSMWNGLMWFAMMIFIVWAAYHYIPEVHDFIRTFQTSWSDGTFHA
jgi:phage shock protein PspC (stress-responsive transcriptional regulator)